MADECKKDDQEGADAVQEPAEIEAAGAGAREREADNGSNQNKGSQDTKLGLTLRILVAAYVLYLAYGLVGGFGETSGTERILIGAAILIFVAAGGAIMFFSAKKLIRKEYRDADEGAEGTKNEEER